MYNWSHYPGSLESVSVVWIWKGISFEIVVLNKLEIVWRIKGLVLVTVTVCYQRILDIYFGITKICLWGIQGIVHYTPDKWSLKDQPVVGWLDGWLVRCNFPCQEHTFKTTRWYLIKLRTMIQVQCTITILQRYCPLLFVLVRSILSGE